MLSLPGEPHARPTNPRLIHELASDEFVAIPQPGALHAIRKQEQAGVLNAAAGQDHQSRHCREFHPVECFDTHPIHSGGVRVGFKLGYIGVEE